MKYRIKLGETFVNLLLNGDKSITAIVSHINTSQKGADMSQQAKLRDFVCFYH